MYNNQFDDKDEIKALMGLALVCVLVLYVGIRWILGY